MQDTTLVLLCAGNSTRFDSFCKKQWLYTKDKPLWLFLADRLQEGKRFAKTLIVASKEDMPLMKKYCDYEIIEGGQQRQYSLQNALKQVHTPYVMVTDVARTCIPLEMIERLFEQKAKADVIVPVLDVSDTVIYENSTLDRANVKLVQTPQLSKTDTLQKALQSKTVFTDESSAIRSIGGTVLLVHGSPLAHKLTFGNDLEKLSCLQAPSAKILSGIGYDIHSFEEGKAMVLGGVRIESSFGFCAHSDGDVAIHAIIDALLGACGYGDIGEFFPDTDVKYKGADSKKLLQKVVQMIRSTGFEILNTDITILMQKPKLLSYKEHIRSSLASLLEIEKRFVNIKATTGEKMGYIGRGEGAAVQAICSVKYFDWSIDENTNR